MSETSSYFPSAADLNKAVSAQASAFGINVGDIVGAVDKIDFGKLSGYGELEAKINEIAANAYNMANGAGDKISIAAVSSEAMDNSIFGQIKTWAKNQSLNLIAVVVGVGFVWIGANGLIKE